MSSRMSIEYNWGGKDRGGHEQIKPFKRRKNWGNNGFHNKPEGGFYRYISRFSETVIKEIRRQQAGRPFLTGVKIENYHHEPARRDLERLGVRKLDTAEIGIGVSDEVHAAFHYANFVVTGDEGHLHDATAITCRWSEEECDTRSEIYESIINGPMFEVITEEVIKRRKKWGMTI